MTEEKKSAYILPTMENNYMHLFCSSLPEGADITKQKTKHPFTLFLPDIVRKRPDVVHLHWPHPYFLFFGVVPTRVLSGLASAAATAFFLSQLALSSFLVDSIVWTVHNKQNHDRLQPEVEKVTHITLGKIADTVVVWDENTSRDVQNTFGVSRKKISIVPHNNYDPIYDGISGESASMEARETCSKTTEYDRTLLYFGRIRWYKDITGLIEAFQSNRGDGDCLIIAGNPSGDLEQEVRTAANTTEHVFADLRFIPDEDVPRYFETADIAVFPYKKIFNSGSVLLAMTFGRPFVAPKMGAIPGVSPDGNVIYDDLQSGVDKALSMPEGEIEEVGCQNREVAISNHSEEAVRENIVSAYGWGPD